MIPKYVQPKSPVPGKITESEKEVSNLEVGKIAWQQFFKSPHMQKIIQTALDNNRDLLVAALNVDAARSLYRVSQSKLLPAIEVEGGLTKQKTPENANFNNVSGTNAKYDANLSVSAFELDLFGKIRSENKSALETFFATNEARNSTQIILVSEVALAYLQLLADQKIWQLAAENLNIQEKAFELILKKMQYGVISKYEVAKARSAIENSKTIMAIYRKKIEQDKSALLLLMGTSDTSLLGDKQQLEDIELMDNLPGNLSSGVLLSRPDIMQAEHQLKSANANIGAARAAFFPTISLTGSLGYASTDLSNLFSGSSAAWSFIPQITLPIFANVSNYARLDYAKISKNIYIAKYEKSIQSAFKEVSNELAARKSLIEQMEAENNLEQAAQDYYNAVKSRHDEGIANFIDVAAAKESLFLARQSKIDTQREKLSNLVQLYKTLGGGL
jgi:multidrug efflux system outer membrane protein